MNGVKTKTINVKIPAVYDEIIFQFIKLGLFGDRNDFINYAIRKTLIEITEEQVRKPLEVKKK